MKIIGIEGERKKSVRFSDLNVGDRFVFRDGESPLRKTVIHGTNTTGYVYDDIFYKTDKQFSVIPLTPDGTPEYEEEGVEHVQIKDLKAKDVFSWGHCHWFARTKDGDSYSLDSGCLWTDDDLTLKPNTPCVRYPNAALVLDCKAAGGEA